MWHGWTVTVRNKYDLCHHRSSNFLCQLDMAGRIQWGTINTQILNPEWKRQKNSWRVQIVASIQKKKKKEVWGTCLIVEHSTYSEPTRLRNTVFTVDLPNCGTRYLPWTCPTMEHSTQQGQAPEGNTLLTGNLPNSGTPRRKQIIHASPVTYTNSKSQDMQNKLS